MTRRWTSDEAFASLPPGAIGGVRALVYAALARALPGGMTDHELAADVRRWDVAAADSSVRTRRDELVQVGAVEASEETRPSPAGRRAIVWRACGPWRAREPRAAEAPPEDLAGAVARAAGFLRGTRDAVDLGTVRFLLEEAYRRDPTLRWRAGGEDPTKGPGGQGALFSGG